MFTTSANSESRAAYVDEHVCQLRTVHYKGGRCIADLGIHEVLEEFGLTEEVRVSLHCVTDLAQNGS